MYREVDSAFLHGALLQVDTDNEGTHTVVPLRSVLCWTYDATELTIVIVISSHGVLKFKGPEVAHIEELLFEALAGED